MESLELGDIISRVVHSTPLLVSKGWAGRVRGNSQRMDEWLCEGQGLVKGRLRANILGFPIFNLLQRK